MVDDGGDTTWRPLETTVDDVLVAIRAGLNAKQMRTIDLFRKIDKSGDGSASIKEFKDGLAELGFKLPDKEFNMMTLQLDKDASGEVTLKELDRALKKAEKNKLSRSGPTIESPVGRTRSLFAPSSPSKMGGSPSHARKSLVRKSVTGLALAETYQKHATMRKQETLQPMDRADEVLCKMKGILNQRKTRMIDVFRIIDEDGSGTVSAEEFRAGLGRLGFTISDDDFNAVIVSLDKDNSGDVDVKEFDKALKLAEKKARNEGRDAEVDTFHGVHKVQFEHENRPYDWSRRSLATDGNLAFASLFNAGSEITTPRSRKDPNLTTSTFASVATTTSTFSQRLRPLDTGAVWRAASQGPLNAALTARVGSGSVHDSSVTRQRIMDLGGTVKPLAPSLMSPELPTYKTVEHVVRYSSRFGAHPVDLQHDSMHTHRHRCAMAERSTLQQELVNGVRKFDNTPMMQSTVDQVVFGRDMDYSGEEKFDEDFMKLFEGAHGLPSWHWGK